MTGYQRIRGILAGPAGTSAIIAALVLVAAALMGGQLVMSAAKTDEASLERQKATAEHELQEVLEGVPRDQLSITVWDDAVLNTRHYDPVWVDENIGSWVAEYFGHNEIYVLDGDGAATFAYAGAQVFAASAASQMLQPYQPLISILKSRFQETRDPNLQVSGILEVRERPVFASISPILPSSSRVQTPDRPFMHVSVRYLDEALSALSELHEFQGATAVLIPPQDGRASLPLIDFDGAIAGYFTWQPYRPGQDLIWNSAPTMTLAVLLLSGLAWWANRSLRKKSAELLASEAHALHMALHDPLTGLANRSLFTERLEAFLTCEAQHMGVALLYVDLDHFKGINDGFGHGVGDQLLMQVSSRLALIAGSGDLVARLSGDEFVVLRAPALEQQQVIDYAKEILDAVGKTVTVGSANIQITCSVGAALSSSRTNATELLRRADVALYRVKTEGRNGIQVYTPEMDTAEQSRRLLEIDLAGALASSSQLHLVYQPLFAGDGSRIDGVEALVRWRHPVRGFIPPSEFIPLAESSGLVITLGEWVLRSACAQAKKWGVDYVAVNVSPIQFRQHGFISTVARILAETGLDASHLELEITEGVLVDKERATGTLSALHAMGVKVAIDDFGTGYSSLSYLRQLDVDRIKIDQSFVHQSSEHAGARSIILAMIQLASALNMHVTAEGVETAEQFAYLSSIGCDQLQGYFLSRPLAPEVLEEKLQPTDKEQAA